jgi:hypothetical protein
MKNTLSTTVLIVIAALFAFPGSPMAAQEVSKVVAVRGKAVIEREARERDAKVDDGVQIVDQVATREASRIKLLFLDESVLTLGEKSRLSVREYVLKKDEKGRSIFNLIDGKMRSVVGKSAFEVHTPTVVAAARGTVILFHSGVRDGKRFTTVQCIEGSVGVSSASPGIAGSVILEAGMGITVYENEPLPSPSPSVPSELEDLLASTDVTQDQIVLFDPGARERGGDAEKGDDGGRKGGPWNDRIGDILSASGQAAPRQPIAATGLTPVTANIVFP